MGIRKSQVDSYLMKISLEKHNRALSYEVHEGHQLPESSINFLGGGRKDISSLKISKTKMDGTLL
jgi:hypothetical protein